MEFLTPIIRHSFQFFKKPITFGDHEFTNLNKFPAYFDKSLLPSIICEASCGFPYHSPLIVKWYGILVISSRHFPYHTPRFAKWYVIQVKSS